MQKRAKILALLLVAATLLCACPAQTPVTTPSVTTPTGPTHPQFPAANLNADRPLPTLAEKFVTDTPAEGDLVLAENGEAKAAIVYPQGNSKAQSAAQELCNYLQKITGAVFAMTDDSAALPEGNLILVGPTKKTVELGVGPYTGYPDAEKISVIRKENCLILCGNDDATYIGTQNAVTYFLEEAGCGWYADSELWQIVPEKATLAVKEVNETFEPAIAGREISNVSGMKTYWYLGGDSFAAGHGLWRWGGKGKYAQHPEWFALVNGSRDPNLVDWWQYCYTNEEWAKHVAAGVVEYFDKNPNVASYSIAPNDGWYEGWCECDSCTATGNQSDQMLLFANRVAEIVAQKYPDKRISFLAYHPTFLPPENEVKAHEIVEVRFCLETSPIDDLMADRQIHNGYNYINKLTYTQSWLDNVLVWIEKADLKNTSIWGWYCIDDPMYKWDYAPWVQGAVADRNVEIFEYLGVSSVFMDGSYQKGCLPLRWVLYYPYAKCMYFGDMSAEAILYDACQKLYGAAADDMFLYYRLLADSAQECESDTGVNWVPPSLLEVYSLNFDMLQKTVVKIRSQLDQLTPDQRERVENQLQSWIYVDSRI